MSNTVYGTIIVRDKATFYQDKALCFSMILYCAENHFGISFSALREDIVFDEQKEGIHFNISDDFLREYCESFLMAKFRYDSGTLLPDMSLRSDIEKLAGLLNLIFKNPNVEGIELYFSDGTAILSDYVTYHVSASEFDEFLFEQYKKEKSIPTIRISVVQGGNV